MELPPYITLLVKSLSPFSPNLNAQKDAHEMHFERSPKTVTVLWPNQVGEVFFDFMADGELLLSQSVEYYGDEIGAEEATDVARTVENFLLNEIRVTEVGWFPKRTELQYLYGEKWRSVFVHSAQ
jgi:hypothetical protein